MSYPAAPPAPWKPAATVAAIIERHGKFLMVEEHTRDGLRINQPAGHLEPGETLVAACAREALEETAHAFEPTALVGVYLWPVSDAPAAPAYLRFAFCGTLGHEHAGRRLDDGIVRTLWLTADELAACAPRHRNPLVLRCVHDYLAGRRYPLALLHAEPGGP